MAEGPLGSGRRPRPPGTWLAYPQLPLTRRSTSTLELHESRPLPLLHVAEQIERRPRLSQGRRGTELVRRWLVAEVSAPFGLPLPTLNFIAVLRVDPTEANMIFRRRRLGDAGWTVTFGTAGGLLTYWVLQPERTVVLLDLTWSG